MSVNSVSAIQGETSSSQSWLSRHPIVAYLLIGFTGTWLLDSPMVFGKGGLGILPFSVPIPLYAILFILGSYAGPTLAALLVTNALEGRAGVRTFLRRYIEWRLDARWYLIAFLYIGTDCVTRCREIVAKVAEKVQQTLTELKANQNPSSGHVASSTLQS